MGLSTQAKHRTRTHRADSLSLFSTRSMNMIGMGIRINGTTARMRTRSESG